MDKTLNKIEALGFEKEFLENTDPAMLENFDVARVTAVHKDSYIIHDGENEVFAELSGKMLFSAASPLDFPAVGDWVLASFHDKDSFTIIHHVLPRKSVLKRKTPGKKIDFQLIAVNIDVAFIVQSLDSNFNLRRIERYMVMAKDSHIEPVVLLSKSDLLGPEEIENRVNEIHEEMPSLQVQWFSNETRAGMDEVNDLLIPRKTYCLLGSSGVGKTSLLNNLTEDAKFTTKAVRQKDSKGRHTTTHRQMIRLSSGAMLVDTPGMRELGNFSAETGIDGTFSEIAGLARQCRFNDCTHMNGKGCAVLKAVKEGEIPEKRYQNYIKMKKESRYHEMSYLEKRQKDKAFGKFCKTVMNHKKNRQ